MVVLEVAVATEGIGQDEKRSIREPKARVRLSPSPITPAAITGTAGTTATVAAVGS